MSNSNTTKQNLGKPAASASSATAADHAAAAALFYANRNVDHQGAENADIEYDLCLAAVKRAKNTQPQESTKAKSKYGAPKSGYTYGGGKIDFIGNLYDD